MRQQSERYRITRQLCLKRSKQEEKNYQLKEMAIKEECFRQMPGKNVVRWVINNFRNLPEVNGEEIESPKFWVSDSKWKILFYPKGDANETKDYISLDLHRESGRNSFLASVTFSIYGDNFLIKTMNIEKCFVEDPYWETKKFIEITELLRVLAERNLNDTFTIECSVYDLENLSKVSTSTQTLKLDDGVQALTKNFQGILVSNNLSDVTIKIQQKEFQAHRAILAARSPVFASMFQHKMKEHFDGVLDITDCDAGSFQLFLLFLYTGKLDKTTNENSINLYQTADKYGLIDLRQMCRDWMLESLEIGSVCDVIDLAMTYEELDLLKKAVEFFTVNAAKIFQTQQWQNFLHEKTSVASNILKQMSEVVSQILIKP